MITAEDIMFWLSGYVTAPGTLTGVVRDTATALRDFGDASGARAFLFLAGLLLYSIRTEARRGE